MKKKSVLLQRDIEDQKEEMKHLLLKERELHDQIKILEKEVSCLSVCRTYSMFVYTIIYECAILIHI